MFTLVVTINGEEKTIPVIILSKGSNATPIYGEYLRSNPQLVAEGCIRKGTEIAIHP